MKITVGELAVLRGFYVAINVDDSTSQQKDMLVKSFKIFNDYMYEKYHINSNTHYVDIDGNVVERKGKDKDEVSPL